MIKLYIPYPLWDRDNGVRLSRTYTTSYKIGAPVTWRNYTYNYGKCFTIIDIAPEPFLHVIRDGVYKESVAYSEDNLSSYSKYFGDGVNVYNRYMKRLDIRTKHELKNYVEECDEYRVDSKVKLRLTREATTILLRQCQYALTDKQENQIIKAYNNINDLYLLSTRDDPSFAMPDYSVWQYYGSYLWLVSRHLEDGFATNDKDWADFLGEAKEYIKNLSLRGYLSELNVPVTKWSVVAKLDQIIRA